MLGQCNKYTIQQQMAIKVCQLPFRFPACRGQNKLSKYKTLRVCSVCMCGYYFHFNSSIRHKYLRHTKPTLLKRLPLRYSLPSFHKSGKLSVNMAESSSTNRTARRGTWLLEPQATRQDKIIQSLNCENTFLGFRIEVERNFESS